MKRQIVFSALLATLIVHAPLQCESVHLNATFTEKIQAIPDEELKQLKELFEHWFLHRGFAYTLFGDKPISCDCSFHEHLDGLFQGSKEQFRIWEKHAKLFPSKQFFFLFYEKDKYEVTLINKTALFNIFEKYRDKFIDHFGPSITAQKLLNLLIEKKSLWNTSIKNREDLMGILFGYGKINAELYQRREEIERKTNETRPSLGFASLEEELKNIEQRLNGLYPDNPQIRRISLPGFVADFAHQETKALIKKYKLQRKLILEKYKNGRVLETSLLQLCSD